MKLGHLLTIALTVATIFASGCANRPSSKAATNPGNALTNPYTTIGVDLTKRMLVIENVLPSAWSAGYIDVIGDGSGAMATRCTSTGGSSSSQGASTCQCTYTYTVDGATLQRTEETVYHDSNLLRCPLTAPSTATTIKVKIHTTTDNMDTADFTLNLSGTSGNSDPTNASLFTKVQRYQCNPIVTIFPFSGSGIYDPFQSTDSILTYPLNYYSSNMGFTTALNATGYGNFQAPDAWNCNLKNDPAAPGTDLRVFSVGPDANGVQLITDATGKSPAGAANDRTNFYLAKQTVGIFNVAVDAYAAPGIYTRHNSSSAPPPLGYGASPLGDESCPTSALVPTGYTWAKLWLFRATLPARRFLYSQRLAALGEVACYPGEWTLFGGPAPGNYGEASFQDCYQGISVADVNGLQPMASRYLGGANRCITPSKLVAAVETNGAGGASTLADPSPYPANADRWLAREVTNTCTAGDPLDYTKICSPDHVPYDNSLAGDYLDKDTNGNVMTRYDFLFVVTPRTVTINQMTNAASAEALKYTPMRYMSSTDCPANDPNACATTNLIRSYGIKLNDVGSSGSGTGAFPVCVLQKTGP